MNHSADWSSKWILYLTATLLYAAALLRSLVVYRSSTRFSYILVLLALWLLLLASETILSRRWHWYFPLYLALQFTLAFVLLAMPNSSDYFSILFCILSMQIMQRFDSALAWLCVGLFTPVMIVPLAGMYGLPAGVAFTLIYTAGNILLASYSLAIRRAQAARTQNESLAQELEKTNRQLEAYSLQREKLAAARERNRLARELHDAATQTIFSMTLATQSAMLLLERDPARVSAQLERLNQLAQRALTEMRTLIAELRPEKTSQGGLAATLREHLANCHYSETLAVSLLVEGDQSLTPLEEQGLFRITQEALNNVIKHAQASRVWIRLHLSESFWIEIQDDGCGFELERARNHSRVGLSSMGERAAEIGWELQIATSPGSGTRIRVEKMLPDA